MFQQKKQHWLDVVYQISIAVRKNLLASQFGFVSQCPHSPTCGEYTFLQMKKIGFFSGLWLGLKKTATCLVLPKKM